MSAEENGSKDEIIEEVRKIKRDLAQAMDFDLNRILMDAKEKQVKSGRTVLSPPVAKQP